MRTTIILGVVSLLLLGFIVFFERGSLSTSEREGRKGRILESFVRERVDRIEIQRKGVTTVIARSEQDAEDKPGSLDLREMGRYKVLQPYAAAADRDAMDNLLASLEWIAPRRSLGETSNEDLAQWGLDKPRYRVTFLVGRDKRSFSIGAPTSDGSGAYLLTAEDRRAYVVGKDLVEALDHEPADYHTKELHDGVSAFTAEKLSIRDASGEHVLQKRGELFWLMRPEPVLASEPALTEILNGFDALKASRFAAQKPHNLAEYGLDAPVLTLLLDSKAFDTDTKKSGTEHVELRVGRPCAGHSGETYVRVDRGPVMCAKDADLEKLKKPAAELREGRLLVLEDSSIRSIELRSGKRELRVEEKDKGGHTFRVSNEGREVQSGSVDEAALADWLKTLRGTVANAFEDDPTVSAGAPTTTLKFDRGKDKPAYEVQVGRTQGERVAVTRGGEKLVAWYGAGVLDALRVSGARFRKPGILAEDAGAIAKVSVTAPGRPKEVVVKSGDRYTFEAPQFSGGLEPERATVDELVRLASKLEAVRFVADAAGPEHGLQQPAYVLSFEYAGAGGKPGTTHTLKLGAATDEGRYAQLDSDPAVFIAAAALVRQVDAPLASRSALSVPLEQIAAVNIVPPAGPKVRVEAAASGGFTLAGGADPARGEQIARAMATLRARAVAYGRPSAVEGLDKPVARIQVELRDGGERTLLVGKPLPQGSETYVRRADLDVSFAVPSAVLETIGAQPSPAAPK